MCKRMAVIGSGRRVWSLGWHDLQTTHKPEDIPATQYLLKFRKSKQLAMYDQLAEREGWANANVLSQVMGNGPFQLLVKVIQDPASALLQFEQAAICNAIGWLHAPSLKAEGWTDDAFGINLAVPKGARDFYAQQPEIIGLGGLLEPMDTTAAPMFLGVCLPVGALATKGRAALETGLHLALDDAAAAATKDFEADWRGFWQAANVLQFASRFTLGATSDLDGEVLGELLEQWPSKDTKPHATSADVSAWDEVLTLCDLPESDLVNLKEHGLPAPEVGMDLVIGVETVGTAELCWVERQVAVFLPNGDGLPQPEGWTVIQAEGNGWVQAVLACF